MKFANFSKIFAICIVSVGLPLAFLWIVQGNVIASIHNGSGVWAGPPPPPSPPNVSVSPSHAWAHAGDTLTFTANVHCPHGTSCNVSASVMPAAGVLVSVIPASGSGNFNSSISVRLTDAVATGVYTLTVTAVRADGLASAATATASFAVDAIPMPGTVVFDGRTPGGSVPADCRPDHAGNLTGNCVYIISVGDAREWQGVSGGPRIDGSDVRMVIRGPHEHKYEWCQEICVGPPDDQTCQWVCETRSAFLPVKVVFGSMERNLQSLSVQANARVAGQILNIRARDLNILSGAEINVSGQGFPGGPGGFAAAGGRDGNCGFSINHSASENACNRIHGAQRTGQFVPGGGESGGGFWGTGHRGGGQGGGFGGRGGGGGGNFAGGSGNSLALGWQYGDPWLPIAYRGSGGGGGASTHYANGGHGGSGGGSIEIHASNIKVDSGGRIVADGARGETGRAGTDGGAGGGGGGSGGSIKINASENFVNNGLVSARGGQGGIFVAHRCWIFWTCFNQTGGGGGGGRIAIVGRNLPVYFDNGTRGGLHHGIDVRGGPSTGHGAQGGGNGTICVGQRPQDCGALEFDFSLSNSGNITVQRGQTSTNIITATLTAPGNPQVVGLSISALPTGLTHQFNPQSGTPTFHSTLAITASQTAATGTIPVTVTGTHGTLTRQTSFSITVTDPPPPPPVPVIIIFTATHNPITRGQSTNLNWTVSGADVCTGGCVRGDCAEWDPTRRGETLKAHPEGSETVTPRITSTYNLTCWNQEGFSDSEDLTVVVQQIRWREVIPRPLMQFIDDVLARVNEAADRK
jgi:hypothetical protein